MSPYKLTQKTILSLKQALRFYDSHSRQTKHLWITPSPCRTGRSTATSSTINTFWREYLLKDYMDLPRVACSRTRDWKRRLLFMGGRTVRRRWQACSTNCGQQRNLCSTDCTAAPVGRMSDQSETRKYTAVTHVQEGSTRSSPTQSPPKTPFPVIALQIPSFNGSDPLASSSSTWADNAPICCLCPSMIHVRSFCHFLPEQLHTLPVHQ